MNTVNNIQGLMYLRPDNIVPFENNPFGVREDEEMQKLMDSIKEYGILTPLVISYQGRRGEIVQLISGHRRLYAAKKLGLDVVPVSQVKLTPEEIAIAVVDSNLQREKILPSERAKAYQLKMDAMKKQGKRSDLTSTQVVSKLRTNEIVGEQTDESRETVRRYIRLNYLIPELLQMVDEAKIALTPAVELSYLTAEEQVHLLETIESEECTPSLAQAQQMKKLSQNDGLDMDQIFAIMVKPKSNQKEFIKLKSENYERFLGKLSTPKEKEDFITKALEYYCRYLERQRKQDREAR